MAGASRSRSRPIHVLFRVEFTSMWSKSTAKGEGWRRGSHKRGGRKVRSKKGIPRETI